MKIDQAIVAMQRSRNYHETTPEVFGYYREFLHMIVETEPGLANLFFQNPAKNLFFLNCALKKTFHRKDEMLALFRDAIQKFGGFLDRGALRVIADDPNPRQTMERLEIFLSNHRLPVITTGVWELFNDEAFTRDFSKQQIIQFMADLLDKGFSFFDKVDIYWFLSVLERENVAEDDYRKALKKFEGIPVTHLGSLIEGVANAENQGILDIYLNQAHGLLSEDPNLYIGHLVKILRVLRAKYPGDGNMPKRVDILKHGTPWIKGLLKKPPVASEMILEEIKKLLNSIEEDMAAGGLARRERSMHAVYKPYDISGNPFGFLGAVINRREASVRALIKEKEALEQRLQGKEVLEMSIVEEIRDRLREIEKQLAGACIAVPAGEIPQCGPICAGAPPPQTE